MAPATRSLIGNAILDTRAAVFMVLVADGHITAQTPHLNRFMEEMDLGTVNNGNNEVPTVPRGTVAPGGYTHGARSPQYVRQRDPGHQSGRVHGHGGIWAHHCTNATFEPLHGGDGHGHYKQRQQR